MTDRFPYFDDDHGRDGTDLDRTAQRLRRALNAEADLIEPGHDGLRRIKERIAAGDHSTGRAPGGPFVPLLAAAAAVLAAAGATFAVVAVQQQPPPPAATGLPAPTTTAPAPPTPRPVPVPTPSGSVGSSPGNSPGNSPDAGPTTSRTSPTTSAEDEPVTTDDVAHGPLPVYWIGPADDGPRLYREFGPDPAAASTVPQRVEAAVRRMLAGEHQDPDYTSPWRSATVEVTVDRTQLTVDLGADAFAGPEPDAATAEVAIQQLVYTVTAAAGSVEPPRTVRVLVEGRAGYEAWGQVGLGPALSRSSKVIPDVWVMAPDEGSRQTAGRVAVTGVGRGFEGLLRWEVTDAAGVQVAENTTLAGSAGSLTDFSFEVELQPGRYTVAVWSPSPKDETDTRPSLDTKTFTVR